MTFSKPSAVIVVIATTGLLHCSSTGIASSTSRDAGAEGSAPNLDSGIPQGDDGGRPEGDGSICGITTPGEVPPLHRSSPVTCSPGMTYLDAGGACVTAADCTLDGSFYPVKCLQSMCTFDECLTDSDCPGQACSCASDYYGGNGLHANQCVPANCHVDSDCGPNGYCSPSVGYCGTYGGFYCHTKKDTCVDPTKDCADCTTFGNACQYSPAAGGFTCGSAVCNG